MLQVRIVSGDISKVKSDVLITAINSGGMWFGGIDGVINRVAGNMFHEQAGDAMPLKHGNVVSAKSLGRKHKGAFENVIFVVDDLEGPLHQIIYNGLITASVDGYTSVTLPTIRMGVMLGVVEKSTDEAVSEMKKGVSDFIRDYPRTVLESIAFVVYDDEEVQAKLERAFA